MNKTSLSQSSRQVPEKTVSICSEKAAELSARDYSAHFRARVIDRFYVTQSMKQTARDFAIPARIVNEILHLGDHARRRAGAA